MTLARCSESATVASPYRQPQQHQNGWHPAPPLPAPQHDHPAPTQAYWAPPTPPSQPQQSEGQQGPFRSTCAERPISLQQMQRTMMPMMSFDFNTYQHPRWHAAQIPADFGVSTASNSQNEAPTRAVSTKPAPPEPARKDLATEGMTGDTNGLGLAMSSSGATSEVTIDPLSEWTQDISGYEPIKPTTSVKTEPVTELEPKIEPRIPSEADDESDDDGIPWYMKPVKKSTRSLEQEPAQFPVLPQVTTRHAPAKNVGTLALIKRGPISAWLDVKSDMESFVQQLIADNEHYATANQMLAADATNWKSACSLAQQQRNALERQIHNNSLTTPLPPLAITAPPLLSPDGLPAPLSPTRDSNPAFFGMLIDEPNTGVPLIHITQLEAGANERRKVVVEKMEREVEEKKAEILELRRELAEAREIVQQQEEEKHSITTYAAIILHADITMFDYKLIQNGRSGGVDTAINVSASIYELCGRVLPGGECPDCFCLMIFMDKTAIAADLVKYGIIPSAETFSAFCDGVAETHGLFVIVDVSGEEDTLAKVKEHFKFHINISACTLLYLASAQILHFASLFQLYREGDKLGKVYTMDLPELKTKDASFPIHQDQLYHIKTLYPDQKLPSEITARTTAAARARLGHATRVTHTTDKFPAIVPAKSVDRSPPLSQQSTLSTDSRPLEVFADPTSEILQRRGQLRRQQKSICEMPPKQKAYVPLPKKRQQQRRDRKSWRESLLEKPESEAKPPPSVPPALAFASVPQRPQYVPLPQLNASISEWGPKDTLLQRAQLQAEHEPNPRQSDSQRVDNQHHQHQFDQRTCQPSLQQPGFQHQQQPPWPEQQQPQQLQLPTQWAEALPYQQRHEFGMQCHFVAAPEFQQQQYQQYQQQQQQQQQQRQYQQLAPPIHPSRQHLVATLESSTQLSMITCPPPAQGFLPRQPQQHAYFQTPAPQGNPSVRTSVQVLPLPRLPLHAIPLLQAAVVELDDDVGGEKRPLEIQFRPDESVCGSEHSSPDLPSRKVSGSLKRLRLPDPLLLRVDLEPVPNARRRGDAMRGNQEEVRQYETLPPKSYPGNLMEVSTKDWKKNMASACTEDDPAGVPWNNRARHSSTQEAYNWLRKQSPRPCHRHYLEGDCKNKSCTFAHYFDLDEHSHKALAKLAKEMVCPELASGRCYRSPDECTYGHQCPRGKNCPWGDKCWFSELTDGHPVPHKKFYKR